MQRPYLATSSFQGEELQYKQKILCRSMFSPSMGGTNLYKAASKDAQAAAVNTQSRKNMCYTKWRCRSTIEYPLLVASALIANSLPNRCRSEEKNNRLRQVMGLPVTLHLLTSGSKLHSQETPSFRIAIHGGASRTCLRLPACLGRGPSDSCMGGIHLNEFKAMLQISSNCIVEAE